MGDTLLVCWTLIVPNTMFSFLWVSAHIWSYLISPLIVLYTYLEQLNACTDQKNVKNELWFPYCLLLCLWRWAINHTGDPLFESKAWFGQTKWILLPADLQRLLNKKSIVVALRHWDLGVICYGKKAYSFLTDLIINLAFHIITLIYIDDLQLFLIKMDAEWYLNAI